jgi:hypothetical protein
MWLRQDDHEFKGSLATWMWYEEGGREGEREGKKKGRKEGGKVGGQAGE